jgi:hypothetical protein
MKTKQAKEVLSIFKQANKELETLSLNELIALINKEQKKQKDFKHLAIKTQTFNSFREQKSQRGFKSDTETIDYFLYLSNSNDKNFNNLKVVSKDL